MALQIGPGKGGEKDRLTVEKWDFVEISIEGPQDGNPFTDYSVKGVFSGNTHSETCVDALESRACQ